MKMECPYLWIASKGKICRLMVKQKRDGELDDFDITHYCRENPNHCYFYRSHSLQKTAAEQLEQNKLENMQVPFSDEPLKYELTEPKISVDHDESHPLLLKLIKKGFRHRLKPERVDK